MAIEDTRSNDLSIQLRQLTLATPLIAIMWVIRTSSGFGLVRFNAQLRRAVMLATDDKLQLPVKDLEADKMRAEIRANARQRDYAILPAALVLGGMLWFMLVRDPQWTGVVSLAAGLGVFWGSRR